MKGISLLWRMAKRRSASCLLVVLFTAAAAAFMLIYPNLIRDTKARLEEAYDLLEVKGWMLNAADYEDPNLPGTDWHKLLESGLLKKIRSYTSFLGQIFPKEEIYSRVDKINDGTLAWAMQKRLGEEIDGRSDIRAYNSLEACDDLVRMEEEIQWLDGYSAECLQGKEKICLLPERFGYALGDTVPIFIYPSDEDHGGIIRVKVVGIYPGDLPEADCVLPIGAAEQLCQDASDAFVKLGSKIRWDFVVNGFEFKVKDNRNLTQLKELFNDLGYDGSGENAIRAVIDDRILKGTVSPIESNLALLQGLYLLFFAVIAMIGFFISFLLARGRKPEYAVMRMLGESRTQITAKAILEQGTLCLVGIMIGSILVALTGLGRPDVLGSVLILLCYTSGAAVAVLLTVRVNVMDILRDKE